VKDMRSAMRRWPVRTAAALALGSMVVTPATGARPRVTKVEASLTAGQVVPKQDVAVPNAKGRFTASLFPAQERIVWHLTVRGLSGRPTQVAIRFGRKGPGSILLLLCPAACASSGIEEQVVAETFAAMKSGHSNVTVYTAKNTEGEIRGSLHVVR
jgi:hypothetical protein